MKDIKYEIIDKGIMLIVPIDASIPLSEYIYHYNKSLKDININMVIIDMLVYVGNRSNRFQYCKLDNGEIEINKMKKFDADSDILERAYTLFRSASLGSITRIFSPSIRKIILDRKMKNCY